MFNIFQHYQLNDATWFVLSLLLILAVFFRFNRLWSLRNLDLLLLLSLSPGLLFLTSEHRVANSYAGYVWLFVCSGLLLVRLFCDSQFKRRPLLEQNLNSAGLSLLCVAAFAFQVTRVFTEEMPQSTLATVHDAKEMINRQDTTTKEGEESDLNSDTPVVAPAMKVVGVFGGVVPATAAGARGTYAEILAACFVACLSHLAVVLGLIFLGRRHLGDVKLGVAMATLYLLMPGTALQVSNLNHILPAAFVVWALVYYNKPMVAGCLMGLACGTVFFPAFLLPLWMVFYGRQGSIRFGLALGIIGAALLSTFALTAADSQSFLRQFVGSIDWSVLQLQTDRPGQGFWQSDWIAYRLPVMAGFLVMVCVLSIFPRKKNIEHLMAHSAAIVVGTQLWYPQGGGVYVLWYLPLLLAVVFRPRLTHLVPPEATPLLQAARNATDELRKGRTFSSVGRNKLR